MRIGIVAGESSGDILGAALITALKKHYFSAEFVGVAGDKMQAAGAKTLFPLDKLSVMGFTEVILRARDLLSLRNQVKQYFLENPPDIYIGIDSPDFNLPIEYTLKKKGIITIHCNSPTIWAWRQSRLKTIEKSVDLMLTLFPFEANYYKNSSICVKYIGHPLADDIEINTHKPDPIPANISQYHQQKTTLTVALLPGSRAGEIKYIGPVLLKSALLYFKKYPNTAFLSPMINSARCEQFKAQHKKFAPELPLIFSIKNTQEVMHKSDRILLASGTAALEAMLLKKPMIVVYKASALTYLIAKNLVKIPYISLPNILGEKFLVPEFIQYQATPEKIVQSLESYNTNPKKIDLLKQEFTAIHKKLRCNAGQKAAEAIMEFINKTHN